MIGQAMTLDEAQQKRRELEAEISRAIAQFESATGLPVRSIDIRGRGVRSESGVERHLVVAEVQL